MNEVTYSGMDLRLARIKADVSQKALAEAMGKYASHISRLEASRKVKPASAQAYLDALATFATVTTASEAA